MVLKDGVCLSLCGSARNISASWVVSLTCLCLAGYCKKCKTYNVLLKTRLALCSFNVVPYCIVKINVPDISFITPIRRSNGLMCRSFSSRMLKGKHQLLSSAPVLSSTQGAIRDSAEQHMMLSWGCDRALKSISRLRILHLVCYRASKRS